MRLWDNETFETFKIMKIKIFTQITNYKIKMKRNRLRAMAVILAFMGFTSAANAQDILGGILSAVKSKATSQDTSSESGSSTTSNILSGLTTIFQNSKVATADKIVGTWVYEEPAVVFESSNVLKKAGGSLVSSAIEKQLSSTLSKYGITPGKMKMTFSKDGTFTQVLSKKTVKGTYTIDGKSVKLTYTGGVQQLLGTTQLDGNSLLIVMDASKLLKFASVLGSLSKNSMLNSATSLLSSMDGMECGVRLAKQ